MVDPGETGLVSKYVGWGAKDGDSHKAGNDKRRKQRAAIGGFNKKSR